MTETTPEWHPGWKQFLDDFGAPLLLHPPLDRIKDEFARVGGLLYTKYVLPKEQEKARAGDTAAAAGDGSPARPAATSTDSSIWSRSGHRIPIRVYTPPSSTTTATTPGPVIVFFHGGGFCVGDLDTDDASARDMCARTGLAVVSVEYRLAPEFPYPAGLDDCVDVTKWALDRTGKTAETGIDDGDDGDDEEAKAAGLLKNTNGKALITGISAGGGLTFSVALRLLDEAAARSRAPSSSPSHFDRIVGLIPQIPVTIDPDQVPATISTDPAPASAPSPSQLGPYRSYTTNANNTINSAAAMREFIRNYGAPPGDVYTNVLLHPALGALPPTYVTVCEYDTLLDDGRVACQMLDRAGVPVKLDVRAGFPHYYWPLPIPFLDDAREEYWRDVAAAVEWILDLDERKGKTEEKKAGGDDREA